MQLIDNHSSAIVCIVYVLFCTWQIQTLATPWIRIMICNRARKSWPFLRFWSDFSITLLCVILGYIPVVNFYIFRELERPFDL